MKIFIVTVLVSASLLLCLTPTFPQTADDYTRKGVEFADKKMYDEALEMFRKAAALQDGKSAKAFHNRGWLMELQGNIPAAMENYQEAIRRNPNLADSYERMGYWYYKAGKYADAVMMGEKTVRLDPANDEVKKWLPDAFKMKLEHPQAPAEEKLAPPSPTAETRIVQQKKEPDVLTPEAKPEQKEEPPPVLGVSLNTVIRTGYKYKSGGIGYYSSKGVIVNLPFMADAWFRPIPKSDTRFSFSAGNPYLGAGIPQTVNQREKIEAVFSFGPFGIGGGFLLSHYYNNLNFGTTRALTDFKLGGVIEFRNKESGFSVSIYPKGIPYLSTNSASM